MGVPLVVSDYGGPYLPPGPGNPVIATVVAGSTRVLIKGRSVATFGLTVPTVTNYGIIITSTLNSQTTLVEGLPVILGGSLTNLSSGYHSGIVFALASIGVTIA